jgi:hypothetical protein
MFGVEVAFEDVETNTSAVSVPRIEDNLEIIETGYSFAMPTNKAAYVVGGSANEKKD